MLDPPRHDTARTIRNLVAAGIKVKVNYVHEILHLIFKGCSLSIHSSLNSLDDNGRSLKYRD